MKKFLTTSIAALSVALSVKAQDIHFSQFYENAILRNPALTGIFSGDYKVGVNYRQQWSDISVPFQTGLISAETRIAVNKEVGDYVSIGVCGTYDHAGSIDFNSMMVYPAINYNKSLEDKHGSYLSVGFAGGYIQRAVDQSKMTFSSQYVNGYNPANPTNENMTFKKIQNYDLSAGISLNSSAGQNNNVNYYIGVAAYHVTKPSQTFAGEDQFIRLNTKWEGNLGIKYNVDQAFAVTLHFNYSSQAPYTEYIGGGLVSWRNYTVTNPMERFTIYAGCFYRVNDALIPTIKVDYQMYSLTFSYDINNSTLKPASEGAGGYEISLYMRGNFKKNKSATDATKCPRFEDMMPGSFTD
jgi:type IX secretion system PorP/SprF family membrane protein